MSCKIICCRCGKSVDEDCAFPEKWMCSAELLDYYTVCGKCYKKLGDKEAIIANKHYFAMAKEIKAFKEKEIVGFKFNK